MKPGTSFPELQFFSPTNQIATNGIAAGLIQINAVEDVPQLILFHASAGSLEQDPRILFLKVASTMLDDESPYNAVRTQDCQDTSHTGSSQDGSANPFQRYRLVEDEIAGVNASLDLEDVAGYRRLESGLNRREGCAISRHHQRFCPG